MNSGGDIRLLRKCGKEEGVATQSRVNRASTVGIGDVRHLECDITKPHIYADYPIDLRNLIIRSETGVGPSFVFYGDKPIDLRTNASIIPEVLDLDIAYDDIFTVYHPDGETFLVGFLASIMAIDEKPYRGQIEPAHSRP